MPTFVRGLAAFGYMLTIGASVLAAVSVLSPAKGVASFADVELVLIPFVIATSLRALADIADPKGTTK